MFNVSALLLDDALKPATPLTIIGAISGVASSSASSSSKVDTLNIWCKMQDVTVALDNNWDNKHVSRY